MVFVRGRKKSGGRIKGTPNERTDQWNHFTDYCLKGGLERFENALNDLPDEKFIERYIQLLEYFKPKLARNEGAFETHVRHTFDEDQALKILKLYDGRKNSGDSIPSKQKASGVLDSGPAGL